MKEIMQKMFNITVNGVLDQGCQSSDLAGNCYYRRGRLKCALGFLIPDSIYRQSMEELDPNDDTFLQTLLKPYGKLSSYGRDSKRDLIEFLFLLTSCHDDSQESYKFTWCNAFLKRSITIARAYNLSMEGIEWKLTEFTK